MGFIDESMLPLCMNTSTIRFKVKDPQKLRIKYFMYYMKSNHFKEQLFRYITGSAQLNYGPSHLNKMFFQMIDIDKQDKVISILDKIQKIITIRQQQILNLDDLIKARFVEMFGDPDKDGKYPRKAIKDLTDVTSGGTPDRKKTSYWNNGVIPWIKTTELQNNILYSSEEFITKEGMDNSSAKMVPKNTVLIAMYGQGKTRGMTALLDFPATTNQACACILPSESFESKFLWHRVEINQI